MLSVPFLQSFIQSPYRLFVVESSFVKVSQPPVTGEVSTARVELYLCVPLYALNNSIIIQCMMLLCAHRSTVEGLHHKLSSDQGNKDLKQVC